MYVTTHQRKGSDEITKDILIFQFNQGHESAEFFPNMSAEETVNALKGVIKSIRKRRSKPR